MRSWLEEIRNDESIWKQWQTPSPKENMIDGASPSKWSNATPESSTLRQSNRSTELEEDCNADSKDVQRPSPASDAMACE